jgi:hypothetical protein
LNTQSRSFSSSSFYHDFTESIRKKEKNDSNAAEIGVNKNNNVMSSCVKPNNQVPATTNNNITSQSLKENQAPKSSNRHLVMKELKHHSNQIANLQNFAQRCVQGLEETKLNNQQLYCLYNKLQQQTVLLQQSLDGRECITYNGVLVWKIRNFEQTMSKITLSF